jgi:alanine racemase
VVDLNAIRSNVAELARRAGAAQVMAVVKANAYGHGLVPVARAALEGGAAWLGAAQVREALKLRDAIGRGPRILAWLYPGGPGALEVFNRAIRADVDLGVSAQWSLDAAALAGREAGVPARVHLKIDTGLGRAGATVPQWEDLVRQALRHEAAGRIQLTGCWSHFAYADAPDHPTVRAQADLFAWAVEAAQALGAHFEVRHLANSAALLTEAGANWDLVRPGLAMYGLSPIPDIAGPAELGLRPAMTFESALVLVKAVRDGQGVSYGHTYVAPRDTVLGLVPVGYADGVPRAASNAGPVALGGRVVTIAGRVCMDQFALDLGPGARDAAGERVVLFGPGDGGAPTVEDWADAAGTISYEIIARLPAHLPRVYLGQD